MTTTSNTVSPKVPAIEMVLNAVCRGTPRPDETVQQFVKRCCKLLNGKTERGQLQKAICTSLSELGVARTDPAWLAQKALSDMPAAPGVST